MRKYDVTTSAVINDYERRSIKPDETHTVQQGILKLWKLNNSYIGVVAIGDITIICKQVYANINSPQDIADDIMTSSELTKSELSMLAAEMGRRGGSARTEAKARASRENGRKGGRPRKTKESE